MYHTECLHTHVHRQAHAPTLIHTKITHLSKNEQKPEEKNGEKKRRRPSVCIMSNTRLSIVSNI